MVKKEVRRHRVVLCCLLYKTQYLMLVSRSCDVLQSLFVVNDDDDEVMMMQSTPRFLV